MDVHEENPFLQANILVYNEYQASVENDFKCTVKQIMGGTMLLIHA